MMQCVLMLCFHLLAVSQIAGGLPSFTDPSGPYEIGVKKIELCEDEGTGRLKYPTKIYSRGHGVYELYGQYYSEVPQDENMNVAVSGYNRGNGGWKFFAKYTFKGCKAFRAFIPSMFKKVTVSMGLKDECPIPQGNNTIALRIANLKIDGLPMLPYGEYKVLVTFVYQGEKVGCWLVFADVLRKWQF